MSRGMPLLAICSLTKSLQSTRKEIFCDGIDAQHMTYRHCDFRLDRPIFFIYFLMSFIHNISFKRGIFLIKMSLEIYFFRHSSLFSIYFISKEILLCSRWSFLRLSFKRKKVGKRK